MASSWPAKLSSSSSVRASRARRARWATSSREIWDTTDKPSHRSAGAQGRRQPRSVGRNADRARCETVLRVPSYLLRVQLADRPGSLGSLAVALGSVGADILSLDVVERGSRLRDRRPGGRAAAGRDARHADHRRRERSTGVRVDSIRPHTGLLEAHRELELIDHIAAADGKPTKLQVLVDEAPRVLRVGWCTVVRLTESGSQRIVGSPGAPETQADAAPWLPIEHAEALDGDRRLDAAGVARHGHHAGRRAAGRSAHRGGARPAGRARRSGRRRWRGWATWPGSSRRSCAEPPTSRRRARSPAARRNPSSSRTGTPSSMALSYFDPGASPATT